MLKGLCVVSVDTCSFEGRHPGISFLWCLQSHMLKSPYPQAIYLFVYSTNICRVDVPGTAGCQGMKLWTHQTQSLRSWSSRPGRKVHSSASYFLPRGHSRESWGRSIVESSGHILTFIPSKLGNLGSTTPPGSLSFSTNGRSRRSHAFVWVCGGDSTREKV